VIENCELSEMGGFDRDAEKVVPSAILKGSSFGNCETLCRFACGRTARLPNKKRTRAIEKNLFIKPNDKPLNFCYGQILQKHGRLSQLRHECVKRKLN